MLVAGFVVFVLSFEVFKLYRQLQEQAGDGVKIEKGIKKWREKKKNDKTERKKVTNKDTISK